MRIILQMTAPALFVWLSLGWCTTTPPHGRRRRNPTEMLILNIQKTNLWGFCQNRVVRYFNIWMGLGKKYVALIAIYLWGKWAQVIAFRSTRISSWIFWTLVFEEVLRCPWVSIHKGHSVNSRERDNQLFKYFITRHRTYHSTFCPSSFQKKLWWGWIFLVLAAYGLCSQIVRCVLKTYAWGAFSLSLGGLQWNVVDF